MNGRPICPSLPSIQVLLLSSFAADILLLHPFTSRPPPSASLLAHPHNSSIALHPFFPLFLSFGLPPSSSTSFHLLVIPLLFTLWPVPSLTPGETREKDEGERKREREGEKWREKKRERELRQRVISAREIKRRLGISSTSVLVSRLLPLRAALLYSKFIRSAFHFHSSESSRLHHDRDYV